MCAFSSLLTRMKSACLGEADLATIADLSTQPFNVGRSSCDAPVPASRKAKVPKIVHTNTAIAPATRTRSRVDGSNTPPSETFMISKWTKNRAVAMTGYGQSRRPVQTVLTTIVVRRKPLLKNSRIIAEEYIDRAFKNACGS